MKFWISPLDKEEEFTIEAHEIDKTILNVPALDRPWLKSFAHLRDVEFPHKAGPIDLILGVQYSHLHAEEEVRQGLQFQPVGKRTCLGWHVIGSDNSKETTQICFISFIQKLNMERFYEFETLGVQAHDCSCPKTVMSAEDRMAMDLFEASCTKEDNRYVIGLPWKKDPHLLPNNYPPAEQRLESLERSLSKNEGKAMMYNRAIEEDIENAWPRPLTEEESQANIKPVYYIPHHGVYRPDNPVKPATPKDRVQKATPSHVIVLPATDINLDGERGQIKTLGVGWNPQTDTVNFTVKDLQFSGEFTKRSVLSKISQIYDPLGLASAVTIKARVALQDIWRSKHLDWDDPLPEENKDLWRNLFEDIKKLKGVEFPRCLKPSITSGPSQLHVFTDASINAYEAVAYLLWPTPELPEVRLISAKARVQGSKYNSVSGIDGSSNGVKARQNNL